MTLHAIGPAHTPELPKRSGCGFFSILFLCLFLCAGVHPAQEVFLLTPPTIDMGRAHAGTVLEDSLRFVNTGKRTLKIQTVGSTCGCTVPALTQTSIPPGDTASVPFTFNTRGYEGIVRKSLTVYFEKNQPEPLAFVLQTEVYNDFEITPRFLFLHRVPKSSKALTNIFTVRNHMTVPLTIFRMSSESPMLELRPERLTVAPGKETSFSITVTPSVAGRHHIQVFLEMDYAAQPKTIIPVYLAIEE